MVKSDSHHPVNNPSIKTTATSQSQQALNITGKNSGEKAALNHSKLTNSSSGHVSATMTIPHARKGTTTPTQPQGSTQRTLDHMFASVPQKLTKENLSNAKTSSKAPNDQHDNPNNNFDNDKKPPAVTHDTDVDMSLLPTDVADNTTSRRSSRSATASSNTLTLPTITPQHNCHWLIFELPIRHTTSKKDSPTNQLAPLIEDCLSIASTIDSNVSLINKYILPQEISNLDPMTLLNEATINGTTLTDARAKKFVKNIFTRDPPKVVNQHHQRPDLLLHFESHVATTANIDILINHLNSNFAKYCGNVTRHPINHCRIVDVGVLLLSSKKTNRTTLQTTITSESAPVVLKLMNLPSLLGLDPKHPKLRSDKTINKARNTILIRAAEPDTDTVRQYLNTAFPYYDDDDGNPSNIISSDQYPTLRRMKFLSTDNLTMENEKLIKIAVHQHTFANSEKVWYTSDFLPLSTQIRTTNGGRYTIHEILLTLAVPYPKQDVAPNPCQPVFHDVAHGILDTEEIGLFYLSKQDKSKELHALLQNLDRAFEIHYGDANLINQVLRPHAKPYKGKPNLLNRWTTSSVTDSDEVLETPPDTSSSQHQETTISNGKKRKVGTPTKTPEQQHQDPKRTAAPRKLFFLEQFASGNNNELSLTATPSSAIVRTPPKQIVHSKSAWRTPTDTSLLPTPSESKLLEGIERLIERQDAKFSHHLMAMGSVIRDNHRETQQTLQEQNTQHTKDISDIHNRLRQLELELANKQEQLDATRQHPSPNNNLESNEEVMEFEEDSQVDLSTSND